VERHWSITIKKPRFVDGQRVDFALRVPEIGPTLRVSDSIAVRHRVLVTAHSRFSALVSVPIEVDVLPRGSAPKRTQVSAALGAERVDHVWRSLATELGVRLEDDALVTEAGAVRVVVERQLGTKAPHLTATLRHPSLGLGLTSEPRSALRSLFGRGIDTGWPRLDGSLRCFCRSNAQGEAWLRKIASAWDRVLPPAVRFQAMTDTEIVLALDDAGMSKPGVLRILEPARQAATLLGGLLSDIPLAPGLEQSARAWSRLAERIGATLEPGTGVLARRDEGTAIEVRPLFAEDGALSGLRIAHLPEHLAVDPIEAEAPEALRRFGEDAVSAATLMFALELGASPALSVSPDGLALTVACVSVNNDVPAHVERALSLLGRLAEALRGQAGPFR
jgi:hypothetical protein